ITGAGTIVADRIAAGSLGTSVIASSVAISGFYNAAVVRSNLGLAIGTDIPGLVANTFTGVQTYGSGASITAGTGLNEVLVGTSVVITNGGITASSGTFTANGGTQYSIETSSGIKVNAGTVNVADMVLTAKAVATNTASSRFHIPKLTQAAIEALTPADAGDLFYNTDRNVVCVSTGTTLFAVAYSSETTKGCGK
ncbi:MAG: hypothetical protein HY746_08150, partial [Elusimicrobia bacterium]|nr:hypothetical protein [Elusimicrobiota bacterium]